MEDPRSKPSQFLVCGDIHGHLQLVLSAAVLWQRDSGQRLDGIFLCGDVGTLTHESEIDNATRAHARTDPAELEFLTQWSTTPPAPWISQFFAPDEEDGLGIGCPIVMVHGNHEGFQNLAELLPTRIPDAPESVDALPTVDPGGRVRWLPSGWRLVGPSELVFAGLGGIERGQRTAEYHELAYLDQDAATDLCMLDPGTVDVLLTHQGPASLQGTKGSETLDVVLESRVTQHWFHGHGVSNEDFRTVYDTRVFPLHDVHKCFREKPRCGFAWCQWQGDQLEVKRVLPDFMRSLRPKRWKISKQGLIISPLLSGNWI